VLNQLEQKVCKRVIALQDELIEVSSKLVAIDTSDPPGENYDACAKFLATYLKELTANVEIVQVPPESLPRHPSTGEPLSKPIVVAEHIARASSTD